jgi:hypothetical protein
VVRPSPSRTPLGVLALGLPYPDWGHYMLPVEAAMGTEVVLLQYGMGAASFLGLDGPGTAGTRPRTSRPGGSSAVRR